MGDGLFGLGRTFCQVNEDSYQLTVVDGGLSLTIDRLRREHHELIGELAVACDWSGTHAINGFLSIADFNLSSAQARTTRARLLAERSAAPDVDWLSLLEELSVRTIQADRQGAPAKPLHTFTQAEAEGVFDVQGWPWLRHHPMITFADGGGLKSYLALYGAGRLAQTGVRIGYVDWELTGSEHRDRLERLFGDPLPVIHYIGCDRPLVDDVDRLRREARRLSLDYLVFDSAGFATAGPPEAAEHALAYFRAVRQIGLGSHHLAHVNRSETGDQKPFGSAFWHNSARATWYAKLADLPPVDPPVLSVGLFNRKSNVTRHYPAIGFQFAFTDTRTRVTPLPVADIEDLAGQLPTWQRIAHLLKADPRQGWTIDDIATELALKPDTVKKATSPTRGRGRSIFTVLPGGAGGHDRIALVERAYAGTREREHAY